MSSELQILKRFEYTQREWFWARMLFVSLWLVAPWVLLNKYHSQPFPEGICQFFNCSVLSQSPFIYVALFVSYAAAALYISGRFIKTSLALLFGISLLIFSLERSNGIYHREELFTLVFMMQLIAHLRYYFADDDFKKHTSAHNVAMLYSIAIVAGAYMMAGISKLQISGLNWIVDSPNSALQTLQSFEHKAVDNGFKPLIAYGYWAANVIQSYPLIVKGLFAFALLAELLAFIACFSKKHARAYGLILFAIHIAMFALLFVKLVVFILAVVVFLINPAQWFLKKGIPATSGRQNK